MTGAGATPVALSLKQALYEHPLASLEPANLAGDLRAVELSVSNSGPLELAIELAAVEFRNTTKKITAKCGVMPFQFISYSATLGEEFPLYQVGVCGLFSAGTISATVSLSVGGNGLNFSESSLELGAKLAASFLPEIAVTILKLPGGGQ